ncbi:fungal-specific transcription factor domain-containing protein [Mycena crocata]|nr:fungal-specific transcription factor domain-containing protein [Mycena crocata]
MSEDSIRLGQNGKRRRLQGSCDICRKKKMRCDSAEMPGNKCTHCITFKTECTHARLKATENAPPKPFAKAQQHIADILSTSTVYIPSNDPETSHRSLVEIALYARSLEEKVAVLQLQTTVPSPKPAASAFPLAAEAADADSDSTSDHMQSQLEDAMSLISITMRPDQSYGESSSVHFTKTAMRQLHGNYVVGVRRPEFWTDPPWELLATEPPEFVFPEEDLLKSLVKIFFEQINPIISILHFPSFQQSISDGVHLKDPRFGAVVLAVCALASRYSDDPRVFLDGANSECSCGWKWFQQVRPLLASVSPKSPLHQLQLVCLSVLFLCVTSSPEECWILVGLGIRLGQGVGIHRRRAYSHMKPLDAELHKRVFWFLIAIDTLMSSFKSQPNMSNGVDFDLDLPVDFVEEIWGISAARPRATPSTSAFIIAYVKLMAIFGRIQRAISPVDGKPWSQNVIAELDSDLNKWADEIPDHLRWDPHQENQIFLDQSAALYMCYYHAQILIHRRFIPAPGKEAILTTTFPSLAICANAARSCGHVLDVQTRRGRGLLFQPNAIAALFDSAVVLLINVWSVVGGRKSRTLEHFNRATADVQNCIRVLRLYERRWKFAGRECDIISAMLDVGKYTSEGPSLKRPRDAEGASSSASTPDIVLDIEHPTAGSSRATSEDVSVDEQIEALERSIKETDHLFSLPLHTEELGRLPVYDSFNYDFGFQLENLHYQPQSHFQTVQPVYEMDYSLEETGFEAASGGDFQMPHTNSFDIPSRDGWREWSAYLASVEGLNSNPPFLTRSSSDLRNVANPQEVTGSPIIRN